MRLTAPRHLGLPLLELREGRLGPEFGLVLRRHVAFAPLLEAVQACMAVDGLPDGLRGLERSELKRPENQLKIN